MLIRNTQLLMNYSCLSQLGLVSFSLLFICLKQKGGKKNQKEFEVSN